MAVPQVRGQLRLDLRGLPAADMAERIKAAKEAPRAATVVFQLGADDLPHTEALRGLAADGRHLLRVVFESDQAGIPAVTAWVRATRAAQAEEAATAEGVDDGNP
ncbi:hypothetical protein [Sinomonas soli]